MKALKIDSHVMRLTKAQVQNLNETAQDDFELAQKVLDSLNLMLGTKYGWLNKRVVWFENPDASTAEKYAHCYDAYAWAIDEDGEW